MEKNLRRTTRSRGAMELRVRLDTREARSREEPETEEDTKKKNVRRSTRNRGAVELRDRCESDNSGDEISDSDSGLSFDSGPEDMFLDGRHITLDEMEPSDVTWEPESSQPTSKRPRGEEEQDSRTRPRGRGRGSSSSRAGLSTSTSGERWNDVDVPDITPPQPTFCPARSPGPQLGRSATYTALQLFQRYFTSSPPSRGLM
ncbi:uncharacterized protein LOC128457306 [Pleuronectes platessa]|uniref:uncharacterized protein LOC128457306 n=1 Tax=Pleuronectes platessa TaxID=8262 RepID=UPI00232A3244|nr:uncharacterized protein LOC128457306 [Pleuronectes platessa]